MHHYLMSFMGKKCIMMTSSHDLGHLFLSNSSFCLGEFSFCGSLHHSFDNHWDLLEECTSMDPLYC